LEAVRDGRIVRAWSASGDAEGVATYCREHFPRAVLPELRALDGFVRAEVLVRRVGSRSELLVLTTWTSLDAVKGFAGIRTERAVVEPVVAELLEHYDDEVRHFTIAFEASA
jgi:heme-degrading monooxygenase HmoA